MAWKYSYTGRADTPIPGVPGSGIIWEPLATANVYGPAGVAIVTGLVDTGAAITILPGVYLDLLGLEAVGELDLSTGRDEGERLTLARINIELPEYGPLYHWSAVAALDPRRDRAIWGHIGFLNHFRALFDPLRREFILGPEKGQPFPQPIDWGGSIPGLGI